MCMKENKSLIRLKICYFGIYRPLAPRDKVYFDGLKKLGVEIIECVDSSSGLLKFYRLFKKHLGFRDKYDILWVGYLSPMLLPLAWLISRKKIIYNALDSWYDRTILDREAHSRYSPVAWVIWLLDFAAFHLADIVLVESEQQKLFIAKIFFVKPSKLQVIFTGVDEAVFYPDSSVAKADIFTVVFRGMFLPATGAEIVLEAAQLLRDEGIKFIIIGWGQPIQQRIEEKIKKDKLDNVKLITYFLPPDELRKTILSAHAMLGQFGDHPRLDRTIQHKTSEALALGMPYITRDSLSSRELLISGDNCLFVSPEDPKALADVILFLKKDFMLRERIASGARQSYIAKCSSPVLAREVEAVISIL